MDSRTLLRFPKPAFRIDQTLATSPPPGAAIATYLEQIRTWRSAVIQFLDNVRVGAALDAQGLSTRAQSALATFLEVDWSEQMSQYALQSPYNISAFPAGVLEHVGSADLENVMEVLRWRAAMEDYLHDIWDVIGDPFLDLDECNAIGQFLYPAGTEDLCCFCLTEIAPDKLNVSDHDCFFLEHVRAKWPAPPPSFRRWMTEAKQVTFPKKWWQFWK